MKTYLASPLGFSQSTRYFMTVLESLLADSGYIVVNPWRLSDPREFQAAAGIEDEELRRQALHGINMKVAGGNERVIRECDIVVAVLDGPDVDSGTASEIGFAFALGKRIYGYRGDFRRSGDNEGCIVNLQVEYWIEKSGGCITTNLDALRELLTGASRGNEREHRAL